MASCHGLVSWPRVMASCHGLVSWLGIKGVFALLVEFVLELEALVVCLCGASGLDGGGNPIVHVPLTELTRGDRTVTRVMIRKASVPPDAAVHIFGQIQALLVAAGFAGGALEMDKVGPRNHGARSFVLPRVVIDTACFFYLPSRP